MQTKSPNTHAYSRTRQNFNNFKMANEKENFHSLLEKDAKVTVRRGGSQRYITGLMLILKAHFSPNLNSFDASLVDHYFCLNLMFLHSPCRPSSPRLVYSLHRRTYPPIFKTIRQLLDSFSKHPLIRENESLTLYSEVAESKL